MGLSYEKLPEISALGWRMAGSWLLELDAASSTLAMIAQLLHPPGNGHTSKWSKWICQERGGAFLLKFKIWVGRYLCISPTSLRPWIYLIGFSTYVSMREFQFRMFFLSLSTSLACTNEMQVLRALLRLINWFMDYWRVLLHVKRVGNSVIDMQARSQYNTHHFGPQR